MSEMPSGWEWSTIDEATHVVLGQSPPGTSYNSDGVGVPFFQGKAEFGAMTAEVRKWTTEPKKLASAGDVLLSVRAPVGAANFAPTDCSVGRGLAALRAAGDVDQQYVFWFIRHAEGCLAAMGTGTTFTAITGSQLKSFPIPVPPLPEQRRIVAAIEEHFSRLDAAEASVSGARRRLALLASAPPAMSADDMPAAEQERERILVGRRERFTAAEDEKMRAHARARRATYSEPLPLPSGLPDPPEGTVWMTLDELCHFTVDYRGKTPPRSEVGIPVISAANVRHGRVLIDSSRCVSPDVYSDWISRGVPMEGDLILTTEAPVAEMALFPEGGPYLPTRRVIVAKTGLADNRYLLKALEHPVAQQHLRQHIRGTTVPRILKPALMSTPVPVAAAHAQSHYVEKIESQTLIADRVVTACSASEKRSKNLRRSILAAAFTGQLVPQDPSDEPASALLERIAAERAASKPSRRKKAAS